MNRRHTRATFVALTAILAVAVVLFDSSTSVPSIPSAIPDAPSREEVQALEELARWVRGGDRVTVYTAKSRDTSLDTSLDSTASLDTRGMADAMRQGRRSFELFRSYNGREANRAYLRDLPYGDQILEAAEHNGLDPLLVAAVVEIESGFHSRAMSHMGALGLMQVMPGTGQMYGVTDLTDPTANLAVGARYFSDLLEYFSGDLELTLAAYNAGPGNVRRYGGIPPFRETQQYVDKVLSAYFQNHWTIWERTGADEQILLH